MDKEFLQYIKETGYDDLLEVDNKDIPKIKDTFHYQRWLMKNAYKDLAKAMRETKLGSAIIRVAEFLGRCFDKIFGMRC